MRRQIWVSVLVSCLVILIGSLAVSAAGSKEQIVTKVAFAFTAGDTSLAAGSYRIEHPSPVARVLTITSIENGETAMVKVITRLAQREHSNHATESNLVFDKVGDEHFLSEVWISGEDGFLVRGTPEEHEHSTVGTND